MYYFAHLFFPAMVALALIVTTNHSEWSALWLEQTGTTLGYTYLLFASPHWLWARASAYFEYSKGSTVGGFVGAHLLLVVVGLWVTSCPSPEAANGWFIYLFGSPVTIAAGALVGRQVARWQAE